MTFSPVPITLKRLPSWSWIPILVFLILLVHGALLGLTDDEAYYWVLAQRPSLGYAFHPPGVAWSIACFQQLFGWLVSLIHCLSPEGLVRLPAACFSAGVLALGMWWMELAGVPRDRIKWGGLAFVSFAGLFASSWMMVPDLPLIFGWMLMFVMTFRICFPQEHAQGHVQDYVLLGIGTALAMLSKYSAVLASASAFLALLIWARREARWRGIAAIVAGTIVAALPILLWNWRHDWASILYQIRDRHSGSSLSLARYAKFWGTQALLAGPPLVAYAFMLVRRVRRAEKDAVISRYVAVWALPAALVFCLQPLWAEFKPHWALIVWLPVAVELGWAWAQGRDSKFAKSQIVYGITLSALGFLLCHVPASAWLAEKLYGRQPDPRWDVTNDMYGWSGLTGFLKEREGGLPLKLPVVGSRYQTSSQAAFAIGDLSRVAYVPRDAKQLDEWPDLHATDGQGPEWPRLLVPVLYVSDNRYDAPPAFHGAKCEKIGRIESRRWYYQAKTIDVWKCTPIAEPAIPALQGHS